MTRVRREVWVSNIWKVTRAMSPNLCAITSSASSFRFSAPDLLTLAMTLAKAFFMEGFPTRRSLWCSEGKNAVESSVKQFIIVSRSSFEKASRKVWSVAFISVLNLFLIPLAPFLIPLLLGVEYKEAVPAFQVLSLAMVFILLSVPAQGTLIYFLSKPKIFFILSLIQFLVIVIFYLIFIPKYGAFGASLAFLISSFLAFVIPTIFVLVKFKKWLI